LFRRFPPRANTHDDAHGSAPAFGGKSLEPLATLCVSSGLFCFVLEAEQYLGVSSIQGEAMGILDLCKEEPAVVGSACTVAEAIQLMLDRQVGAAAVSEDNRVVGIFTERDVMSKLALSGRDPGDIPVRELMSTPVETATPDISPGDALALMVERHFRHLPIVDDSGKLLAILSSRSLLQAQVEELRQQLDSMEQYVSNDSPGG
jgi:CBS domain-containing protein